MTLLENLQWRYATKKFSNKNVEQNKIDKIVEAINLSATSTGLQPFRLFVVKNKELQKVLGENSFNSQIEEASHLLVFASFDKVTEKHIDEYMSLIAKERNQPVEKLTEFRNTLVQYFSKNTPEENAVWAAKQAYIGLGTALIAAAELQIDSTPMEGFDKQKFGEVLHLKEKGLKAVVLLALGYSDTENDWNANLKKVRLPIEEFATKIA
ncbi:nitroreductase family protein [Myroides indicus]|uniref:Nitroreductase n=1 Tax=Myroides indicus TaxID=1323422 RepID=A0A4R7ENE7_9FLAO|nr:nitroreductase family protein [Myroides indicus]TDS52432.1 nitroreductase [Myroides indicus]